MKTCFKCGVEKPLCEFYKHKEMGDGHLNKCKECTKMDASNHRKDNIEKIRSYDRDRAKTQKRKIEARKKRKEYRLEFPEKYKAHNAVSNSIRDGRLIRPDKCDICKTTCVPHGHHESYDEANWLDVVWVCVHCHIDIHAEKKQQP